MLHKGKCVRMPNGETMVATQTTLFPSPQPPLSARNCDVLSAPQQPLLYLGQFYDEGFSATLDSDKFQLNKDGIATLSGTSDHNNGLYFIPL